MSEFKISQIKNISYDEVNSENINSIPQKTEISFKKDELKNEKTPTEIFGGQFSNYNKKSNNKELQKELNFIIFDENGNIDTNQFSLESLSKKYPTNKYITETINGRTTIKNKDTNKIVLNWEKNSKWYVDENENKYYKIFKHSKDLTIMQSENTNNGRLGLEDNIFVTIKNEKIKKIERHKNEIAEFTYYDPNNQEIIEKEIHNIDKKNKHFIKYLNGEEFITTDKKGEIIRNNAGEKLDKNLSNPDGDPDYCKKMLNLITNLKEEEFEKFMESYAKFNKTELIDAINNSKILSTKEKKEFLKEIMKDFYNMKGYSKFKKLENQQVNNKYYTGDTFDVKYSGQVVNITNNRTKETRKINLAKLYSEMNKKDRKNLSKLTQKLPAEVLFDLSVECSKINSMREYKNLKNQDTKIAGFYSTINDEITTKAYHSNNALKILIHELGHAIDNTEGIDSTIGSKFEKTFNKELNEYKQNGNKQFDYKNPPKLIEQIFKKDNYCTANAQEMFAECYVLLLTGKCNSSATILKHFPKSLEAAKEHLIEIRNKKAEERHYIYK